MNRNNISIHALREEGDGSMLVNLPLSSSFLSTPSARRATVRVHEPKARTWNFYPRPPRGGRLPSHTFIGSMLVFLSTPSARRATSLPVRL